MQPEKIENALPGLGVEALYVGPRHFEYLKIQRGRIWQKSNDFDSWLEAYRQSLWEDFCDLRPHLPKTCHVIIDVGSGLGGLGILLSRHYNSTQGFAPVIVLVDGKSDEPVVIYHNITFSNLFVAEDFYLINHAPKPLSLNNLPLIRADLIVSTQAWCFHIDPRWYEWILEQHAWPGIPVMVDLRKELPDWNQMIHRMLDKIVTVYDKPKYRRLVGLVK